eukprot:Pgem_evm1s2961
MYCAGNGFAIQRLAMVENSRGFKEFLRNCAALPVCRNLDLGSFLLMPVQRICKYPLLLRE